MHHNTSKIECISGQASRHCTKKQARTRVPILDPLHCNCRAWRSGLDISKDATPCGTNASRSLQSFHRAFASPCETLKTYCGTETLPDCNTVCSQCIPSSKCFKVLFRKYCSTNEDLRTKRTDDRRTSRTHFSDERWWQFYNGRFVGHTFAPGADNSRHPRCCCAQAVLSLSGILSLDWNFWPF